MTLSCGLSPTNARCILSYCVTFMYILLHTFSKRLAKFKVQNEANLEKGNQHDSADVTFRIVPITDENWQARIGL